VKLQVDHVLPVSAGGTNKPENLATACAECNIGKGSALINGMGLV
jgi:5-methylcytosine-specific restriction endonuclease McrA